MNHFELLIESETNLRIWYKDMDQFNGLVLVKDSNEQGVECNPLRRINGAKRRAKMNII